MPVFKIAGFGDDVIDAKGGDFQPYDGPIPPKGTILEGVIRQLQLAKNRNDELMLKCLFEAKGNDGDKEKYNGLPVWWNGNITEQGKGFVNDFLVHLALFNGFDPKMMKISFWKKGPAVDSDKLPSPIKAIGTFAIDVNGMASKISTRVGNYKGEEKAEVLNWIIPKQRSSEAEKPRDTDADDNEVEVIEDDPEAYVVEDESPKNSSFSDEPPF